MWSFKRRVYNCESPFRDRFVRKCYIFPLVFVRYVLALNLLHSRLRAGYLYLGKHVFAVMSSIVTHHERRR